MLTRRTALQGVATAAAGVVAQSPQSAASEPNKIIPLRASKDGFVGSVFVSDGAKVTRGDKIAAMDSTDEDRMAQRLALAKSLVEIEKNALCDDNVDRQKESLTIAQDLADCYKKLADANLASVGAGVRGGVVARPDLLPAQVRAERAAKEVSRTATALLNFKFAIDQANARQQAVDAQIRNEENNLSARRSALTITALSDGTVNLTCVEGQYVLRGDILATIEIV